MACQAARVASEIGGRDCVFSSVIGFALCIASFIYEAMCNKNSEIVRIKQGYSAPLGAAPSDALTAQETPLSAGRLRRRRVAVPWAWGAGRPPTSISSCARLRGGQAPDQGRLPQARRAKRGHPPCDVLRALRHSDLRSRLRRHCNAGGRASLGGRGFAPHLATGCLGTLRSPFGDALRLMAPPRPSPPEGSGAQAGRLRPAFGGPHAGLG